MAVSRHPLIAREGWWHIAIVFVVAVAVHYNFGWIWAAPLWIFLVFNIQFFRDPNRKIPSDPMGVVCPADGRVVMVEDGHDPYLDRPAKVISIFMNVFNVHANRSPVEGKVKEAWYRPGKFFNAALHKASTENERNALWIQTDEGDDLTVVQIAGLIARRIHCYKQPGERVGQGERYGFIRFGSRVDVYIPHSCKIQVALGDKVKGGRDIIAVLVH